MKQNWLCIAVSVLLCMSLSACTGGEQSGSGVAESTSASGVDAEQAASADKKEAVTIEYWFGLGGQLGNVMQDIIKKFNESQDGVVVTGIQQSSYSETQNLVQAAIAAGDPPSSVLGVNSRMMSSRGMLEILDDYIAETTEYSFDRDDFMPAFMDYCLDVDGRLIGLPTYGSTQVLYYSKAAFEEAGIDPDKALSTWENLAEAAAKMTKREGNETVFYGWEPMWGTYNMIDSVFSRGGRIYSDDQKKVLLDSPEWIETLDSFRKWIHEDEIMRIHFGGEGWEYWYKTIDDVLQGRAAGYTGSSGDQGDLDFDIVMAHVQPGWGDHPPAPQADAVMSAILSKASPEEKQAAFKWLSFLTGPEMSAYFSMKSGYIPVRKSSREDPEFKTYLEEHPYALVPIMQAELASMPFNDITGGKISTAISDAVDLVQIENVPAAEALAQAQVIAQAALDEYWESNPER